MILDFYPLSGSFSRNMATSIFLEFLQEKS